MTASAAATPAIVLTLIRWLIWRRGYRCGIRSSAGLSGTAIFWKVMPSYRDLLAQVKTEIDEVDAARARELLDAPEPPLFVDVRESDEWDEGHVPGAVHLARGFLESRIETAAPDHAQRIVVYCAGGARSAGAVDDDPLCVVGRSGLDPGLEKAAGEMDRAGNVALVPLVRLADVDEERRLGRVEKLAGARGVHLVDLGLDLGEQVAVARHDFPEYSGTG